MFLLVCRVFQFKFPCIMAANHLGGIRDNRGAGGMRMIRFKSYEILVKLKL